MNKKGLIALLSTLVILVIIIAVFSITEPNPEFLSYKEFKEKTISGEVLSASISKKEIGFKLKDKSRRFLYKQP